MQAPNPTVISSKSFPGVVTSPAFGNVAWNDDGQCFYVSAKSVNILTPHIGTFLPPPTAFLNPDELDIGSNPATGVRRPKLSAPAVAVEDDDEKPNVASGSKTRRPKVGGELAWWSNGVDVDKDKLRAETYGWVDVGDELNTVVFPEENEVRQAVWSPSGLSDLGRCLLGVMNSQGQISIYAPHNDPYAKKWDEIADLTILTKQLLPKPATSPVTSIPSMLEMRAVCMAWSPALPLPSMLGIDGSLLVVASRAGTLAFWSYGPSARFHRVAHLKNPKGLVNRKAWSAWKLVDASTCEARLALGISDGSIHLMKVRQSVKQVDGASRWTVEVVGTECVDTGDGRMITALKWNNDMLVWTKPASVHLYHAGDSSQIQWTGLKSVRLERVGNWAGANALGPCIGIQAISPDSLLIVLSSLTHHIITNISTDPHLAPPPASLAYSLASRQVAMDHARTELGTGIKGGLQPKGEKNLTAHTTGWAGIGENGDLSMWACDPTNFHDLDFAADGRRIVGFMASENGVGEKVDLLAGLKGLFAGLPRLIHSSPLNLLLPHLLRLRLSLPDESAASRTLPMLQGFQSSTPPKLPPQSAKGLNEALWSDHAYWDGLRLQMVLAQYCASIYPSLTANFKQLAMDLAAQIRRHVAGVMILWIAHKISLDPFSFSAGSADYEFAAKLIPLAALIGQPGPHSHVLHLLQSALSSSGNTIKKESCPACGEVISDDVEAGIDEAKCANGHSWSRCSITSALITTPSYRVCTICPAIAHLPARFKDPSIPVSNNGIDTDWQRYTAALTRDGPNWIVQEALMGAMICVRCGGRWMRSM